MCDVCGLADWKGGLASGNWSWDARGLNPSSDLGTLQGPRSLCRLLSDLSSVKPN